MILILSAACTQTGESNSTDENGTDEPEPGGGPQIGEPATYLPEDMVRIPEGWWESIPFMAGFEVDDFRTSDDGMMAVLHGEIDIERVADFYSTIEGWEPDPDPELAWTLEGEIRKINYVRDEFKLVITISALDDSLGLRIVIVK